MAFGKPPVKPKPEIETTYSGHKGALAAATKAGNGGHSRKSSKSGTQGSGDANLEYQNTGSSAGGESYTGYLERQRGTIQHRLSHLGGDGFLQLPTATGAREQLRSPSFIAATIAASRSASISPNPTGDLSSPTPPLRRPSSFTARSPSVRNASSSKESSNQVLDITPIAPTASLIGMFEQSAGSPRVDKKRPAVRGPTTSASIGPSPALEASAAIRPPRAQAPSTLSAAEPRQLEVKPSRLVTTKAQSVVNTLETGKPTQKPRRPPRPNSVPQQKLPVSATKPVPIPTKVTSPNISKHDDVSSDDSFVSASDFRPSFRVALSTQNRRLTSTSAVSVKSSQTVDSLANAIVASSLASSRAASPSKASTSLGYPPLPPPRRNGLPHLFHNSKEMSRTPSPSKTGGLRTTMRKPKEEEVDEGERRRVRKSLMKKHPHKHHEGDRKRWRDSITERERKRYEAVWASNKGLYSSSNDSVAGTSVCNLVARDIFSRSRLHVDVLEEVYELVDRRGNGTLGKEEFVVGLWLIDQRLKGRKLPIRVTESVWKSVGILSGIKVRKAHHQK